MNFDMKHEANSCIAQQALTNSKHPDRFVNLVPSHIKKGKDCYLYDMDDRKWIDLIGGLGTNHFGYGNEKIQSEVIRYAFHGDCHSLPTYHEVEAAQRLKEIFPFIERVKFVNDGSSACTAACEMARACTGREWILTEGYHGWHPEMIDPVAKKTHANNFHIDELQDNADFRNVAAVIVEPVQIDNSKKRIDWLKDLKKKCDKYGTVMIWDEVITGLRYPQMGVSNCYGITPDILLLGKALGNGHKIAAVCGHKDILDADYFVSGTYHGQIAPLVAAKAAMKLAKFDSRYDLKRLNEDSLLFFRRLSSLSKHLAVTGWGCRGIVTGKHFALFQQEMARQKILVGPSIFMNFHSQKIIDDLMFCAEAAMERINSGVKLEGPAPTGPFSERARK